MKKRNEKILNKIERENGKKAHNYKTLRYVKDFECMLV